MTTAQRPYPDEHRTGGGESRIRLADGRILAVLELGEPGGRPVFYFHGFPGSRLEARLAADAAGRLGLRLLAPDRPGFGASTFKPGRTIGAWAGDMAEFADRLRLEQFDIVGVSGGGPYALACAARFPERLRQVALVAAVGPMSRKSILRGMAPLNHLALSLAARIPPMARLAVRMAALLVRKGPERYLEIMMSAAPPADRAVVADEGYRALLAASTTEALRQGGRGAAWELALLARPWDFSLQKVTIPVRLWQGLEDNIVPVPMARQLATTLPYCESRFLPGEGHLSLIVHQLSAVLADLLP